MEEIMKKHYTKIINGCVLNCLMAASQATTVGQSCKPHYPDTQFFWGLGVGAEQGVHNYKVYDINLDRGAADKKNTNSAVILKTGFISHLSDTFFAGIGFDLDLSNHRSEHTSGNHSYDLGDIAAGVLPYLEKTPMKLTFKKSFSFEPYVKLGTYIEDTRLYVKLGANYTRMSYAFETGDPLFKKSNFSGKSSGKFSFAPGLGMEYRVKDNMWIGFEGTYVSPHNKEINAKAVAYDGKVLTPENVQIKGQSKFWKLLFHVKYFV